MLTYDEEEQKKGILYRILRFLFCSNRNKMLENCTNKKEKDRTIDATQDKFISEG
jgi:hypothetical protein